MPPKRDRIVYQFRIVLRCVDPPVWRRFQVWEDVTLNQLHQTIQTVMGWENYHLNEFVIGRRKFGPPDPDGMRPVINSSRVRLCRAVNRVGREFEYLYDFGDGWWHDLLLEAILLPEPNKKYPHCLGGAQSCPPEDVGGPHGYVNYLAALADTNHERHEEMMQWRGPFDSENFSLKTINQLVNHQFQRARRTAARLH